jgi:UDP-N-acetyl-D-mannosaminuronic acid transferase (WecB/TagA/CpsF family)
MTRILGIDFFCGDVSAAVKRALDGGLVVAPNAPGLATLGRDREYAAALLGADLVLPDSGFMVLLWNAISRERLRRVSGLEYLALLLREPALRELGATFWVMPSAESQARNLAWLRAQGLSVAQSDCYVAPKYSVGAIEDVELLERIRSSGARHVVIAIGGGVQERLGFFLKEKLGIARGIHCIGAAIGFLSGDQVRIPMWADAWLLGWLFRCVSAPTRSVPRYVAAARATDVAVPRSHA